MNILSLSVSALFAIAAAVFAVGLLAAILYNQKIARRYRQAMAERLSRLRLSNMLSHKGIDQGAYLHTQPVLDIEQQMKRCGSCAQTERCDRVLATGSSEITDFCANDGDLQAVKRKLESAA